MTPMGDLFRVSILPLLLWVLCLSVLQLTVPVSIIATIITIGTMDIIALIIVDIDKISTT